jgi:hypothetical protein
MDSCKKSRSRYYEKKAAFITKWPNYCRKCSGLGGKFETDDPSPAGVGLSPGFMTTFVECDGCLFAYKCPRCKAGISFDDSFGNIYCKDCGWDSDEAESDNHGVYCLPPEPECLCYELYEPTEQQLEEDRQLEVDLANDPEVRARRADADEALDFLIGDNDREEEGDNLSGGIYE